MSKNSSDLAREAEEAHRQACVLGLKTYIDPATGYEAYTRRYLIERGYCCNQGCGHCPYTEMNINTNLLGDKAGAL